MEINISVKSIRRINKELGNDALNCQDYKLKGLSADTILKVSLHDVSDADLLIVQETLKLNEESEVRKVSALINSLADVTNRKVANLRDFPRMFEAFIATVPNSWLFSTHAGSKSVAFAFRSVTYRQAYQRDEPMVLIVLGYNSELSFKEYRVCLTSRDMGESVPRILLGHKLIAATDDLIKDYTKHDTKYQKHLRDQGEQFRVRGEASIVTNNDYWWNSRKVNLTSSGKATKAVLDMESLRDNSRNTLQGVSGETKIPTHPVLRFFSLKYHSNVWVNVNDFRPYEYENLADRLVLPASHSRLIGALVSNLDALKMENESEGRSALIRAKASSSIILCKGPAGVGKTLCSEVYAEEIKRPLYEIAGGQLGATATKIEENLEDVLARAVRLRMPIVINEADVFIRKRGDDFLQTSIVAVFLRLLEYHNGLVFLTTNRDDIDDAIQSRCLAVIDFKLPALAERIRIWESLLAEFNVELTPAELKRAGTVFPSVSGRDIQNLIRLTTRTCTALNEKFSLQALKANSTFRGIEVNELA